MFQNKTQYTVLILFADNPEDSEKFQKLIGRYGFYWVAHDPGYIKKDIDETYHLYLILKYSEILWCRYLDKPYLMNHIWNDKIYTIKDYDSLKCMLEYGQEGPSYKPRKIDRTL